MRKRVLFFSLIFILISAAWVAAKLRASVRSSHVVLWTWERPEDLRFLAPGEANVAFLAQTITLAGNDMQVDRRRQPLRVNPGTRLIAVTRIEVARGLEADGQAVARQSYTTELVNRTAEAIAQSAELPGVAEVQIDFDATLSQRGFYSQVVNELRPRIGGKRLSITALASWCMNDGWIRELAIDEAVPMVFQMGPDDRGIRKRLQEGDDWTVESCRGSYGVSTFERAPQLRGSRTLYVFTARPWTRESYQEMKEIR